MINQPYDTSTHGPSTFAKRQFILANVIHLYVWMRGRGINSEQSNQLAIQETADLYDAMMEHPAW